MRAAKMMLAGVLMVAGNASAAAGEEEDWQLFGRVLSLVQSVVHGAAQSDDPRALEKGVDRLFSGEHREASRLASDLMSEAFDDMPAQYRGAAVALAKDLATIARKERVRQSAAMSPDAALQARKDLAAMGLRYFDPIQFLDAVKRDDLLAAQLYVVAGAVDLGARDGDGLTALQIAQRRNNRDIAQLLASVGR